MKFSLETSNQRLAPEIQGTLSILSGVLLLSVSLLFWFGAGACSLWNFSSTGQASNPCPLQWKHGVLTSRPPWKSDKLFFHDVSMC